MLVVIYHVVPAGPIHRALTSGYLAVDVFFVLSGFVMTLTYGSAFLAAPSFKRYGSFLWARFARIYPLYGLLTAFLIITGRTGLGTPACASAYAAAAIANLTLTQAWGWTGSVIFPAWSISTEVVAYLLFPLLLIVTMRRSVAAAAAVTVVVAIYVHIVFMPTPHPADVRHGPLDCSWIGSWWPVARCCAGFVLGMIAFRLTRRSPAWRWLASPSTAPVCACVMIVAFFWHGADLLFVATTPVFIAAISSGRDVVSRLLAWTLVFLLGEWSYALYLLHSQFFTAEYQAARFMRHVLPPSLVNSSSFVATLVTLIAASAMVFEFVEKPGRRILRRFDGRRRPLPAGADPAAP